MVTTIQVGGKWEDIGDVEDDESIIQTSYSTVYSTGSPADQTTETYSAYPRELFISTSGDKPMPFSKRRALRFHSKLLSTDGRNIYGTSGYAYSPASILRGFNTIKTAPSESSLRGVRRHFLHYHRYKGKLAVIVVLGIFVLASIVAIIADRTKQTSPQAPEPSLILPRLSTTTTATSSQLALLSTTTPYNHRGSTTPKKYPTIAMMVPDETTTVKDGTTETVKSTTIEATTLRPTSPTTGETTPATADITSPLEIISSSTEETTTDGERTTPTTIEEGTTTSNGETITTTIEDATTTTTIDGEIKTTSIEETTTTKQDATTTIQDATTTIQDATTTTTTTVEDAPTTKQDATTTIQDATTTIQDATTAKSERATTTEEVTTKSTTMGESATTTEEATTTTTTNGETKTTTIDEGTTTSHWEPTTTRGEETVTTTTNKESTTTIGETTSLTTTNGESTTTTEEATTSGVGPCFNEPCQNNGTCVAVTEDTYECLCPFVNSSIVPVDIHCNPDYLYCLRDEAVDGRQPHPLFCTHFMECSNGRLYERECAETLHFNQESGACTSVELAECQQGIREIDTSNTAVSECTDFTCYNNAPCTMTTSGPKCQCVAYCGCGDLGERCEWSGDLSCIGRPDGFYTSATNCQDYFSCTDQFASVYLSCPDGQVFDPVNRACNFPQNVPCSNV